MTELTAGFRVSRPAISRHLRVLRNAHLVREKKEGRQRIYQLEPEGIQEVANWAEHYRTFWHGNITRLKHHLEQPKEERES